MQSEIESHLQDTEVIPVAAPTRAGAPYWHISSIEQYESLYQESIESPETFYRRETQELSWLVPWEKLLSGAAPHYRWFEGAKTNLCHNCVDRHVEAGYGDEVAIIWEAEALDSSDRGEIRTFTYHDLQLLTSRFANMLRAKGVQSGDVVTLYMGMVPELAIAVLGCARMGAVHSVIFGGFSSQSIADRVLDASSKVIVTCDGLFRRGKIVPLKANVDEAISTLAQSSPVETVIVYDRCELDVPMEFGRDFDFEELMAEADSEFVPVALDSEATSFLLYTSGSTGKPKGIVHTTAGYMVHTYLTAKYVFNLIPSAGQVFWCTADIGWITGHSYILYGIMANRVPTLMYEGAPDFPNPERFWSIIERHRVTHFYTAPTAIRAFMKWGTEHPSRHDLSSLQVLGSVGEPINPAAWLWYYEHIGEGRCPIVDTYWQTETGGHMLTPLPGVHDLKPGSCMYPFFGVAPAIVDRNGDPVTAGSGAGGLLVVQKPWPSMLRGVYRDEDRFVSTYWSNVRVNGEPVYFAGDGARQDADGAFWVMGRVDDVMNVSGHRLGTMELESALVSHQAAVEAAVVGIPHDIKGTGIAAFVTVSEEFLPCNPDDAEGLRAELAAHVVKTIGAIARPDVIRFTDSLPKTRSGKIMRRLLRDVAAGEESTGQDMSTLEDFSVLARLRESEEG